MDLRSGFSDSNEFSNGSTMYNNSSSNGEARSNNSSDITPLKRLSENLGSILEASTASNFFADAKIVAADGRELAVHRCILAARSGFFKDVFCAKERSTVMLQMKEVAKDYDVGLEALGAVLGYLYSGRVNPLPKGVGVCACVDDDCSHLGCWPALDFMLQLLYASSLFRIIELVSLYQVTKHFKK